jgi:hypothetical protein
MDNWKDEVSQVSDEFLMIDKAKMEIIDSLDNALTELKSTVRKAIWTLAIVQYLVFVGSVLAVLHYWGYHF